MCGNPNTVTCNTEDFATSCNLHEPQEITIAAGITANKQLTATKRKSLPERRIK